MSDRPIVTWCCNVFDRRTKKLPLDRKWRILDWSRMPSDKVAKVEAILTRSKSHNSPVSPKGFDEVVHTLTVNAVEKLDVEDFREYFIDVTEEQVVAEMQLSGASAGFTSLPFDPDYVEDETGVPTTHLAIIECVHGVKEPIIFGESQSLLVRELRDATNSDKWSVEKANICAQFLEVVSHISRSQWIQNPPTISYIGKKSGDSKLVAMKVPSVEATMAVLAFVRQIFAEHRQDGLFAAACEIFSEHCGDGGKVLWMNERISTFTNTLGSANGFFDLGGRTCLQILNMFLYGAGLMHAKPHSQFREDDKLAEAIEEFGRERVIAAFHFVLHSVMQVPFSAYPVIRKEFQHWISNCAFTAPSRVRLATLFANVGQPITGNP